MLALLAVHRSEQRGQGGTCRGEEPECVVGGGKGSEAVACSEGNSLFAWGQADLPVAVGSPAVKGAIHDGAGGILAGGAGIHHPLHTTKTQVACMESVADCPPCSDTMHGKHHACMLNILCCAL